MNFTELDSNLKEMELELSRVDYTLVGVTSQGCMKLIPNIGPKEPQKVAVADNDGILQVFSIKKQDVQLQFKTLPGPKITALRLGGASGSVYDKIFVSSGNEVRGYTKKGKLFLSFDSNLTEPIISMFIIGSDLFVCGKHILNHYRDCKEIGSYLCGDSIVDVVAFYSQKNHRLISLIACEGRMIRTIEHARVTLSIEVESAPTVLYIYEEKKQSHILFGTLDGRIGLLDIEKHQSFSRWLINNEKFSSSITCIDSYNFLDTESEALVIGRNDGNIEVYSLNIDDEADSPMLLYTYNCNESITSVQCGVVGNQNYDEILVCTFTGKVFGLTTEVLDKNAGTNFNTGNVYSYNASQKISKLRNEIEELQIKVVKEREKYQAATQSFQDEYSAIPTLEIKDSIILSKTEAAYTLTLEVPAAIDNVLLQSDVPIDLLDVEKNSAVVSYSESDPQSGNFLLATYRCQINTNRLEVRIRTIEGQSGTLQAYVTPLVQPKCCILRRYEIKPLSHHLRIHSFDENRPLNVLRIKGSFSLAEIHSWIMQCFLEVPDKPQLAEKTILTFQSTFLDTIVNCAYSKNEGEFKSDNISTISILKDIISKEATKKKIKIDISTVLHNDCVSHILKIVDPKLKSHSDLSNKILLLDALREMEVNDEEATASLSGKYKQLLLDEKELRVKYSSQPSYLDRLYGIITDLYVDYYKFKGINVRSKIPKLIDVLENYNYEALLEFFTSNA